MIVKLTLNNYSPSGDSVPGENHAAKIPWVENHMTRITQRKSRQTKIPHAKITRGENHAKYNNF
jgi:hypothetical protein